MKKKNLFLSVVILYIMFITNTFISSLLPIPIEIISILPVLFAWVLYPSSFKNNLFYSFCFYAFISLLYLLYGRQMYMSPSAGNTPFRRYLLELAFILPSISIHSVLWYLKDDRLYYKIIISVVLSLSLTFILILPSILFDSSLLRYAALQISSKSSEYTKYARMGIPSYNLLHAYSMIFPAILSLLKYSKMNNRPVIFLFLIVLLLIIVKSAITTIIISSMIVVVFCLIYSSKIELLFLRFCIAVLLVLFINYSGILFDSLVMISDYYKGTSAESKMTGFLELYANNTQLEDLSVRENLHAISKETFINNPICGDDFVGGHSVIFDHLGASGLIGFIPYILIFFVFIIRNKNLYTNPYTRQYFIASIIVAFIILFQKGLWGQEGYFFLFVVIPGFLHITYRTLLNNII